MTVHERASAQDDREIARFFDIEVTSDRCPAAADPFLNHRGGINPVIEHDGEAAFHVGGGDLFEEPAAGVVQNQLNRRP